MGKPVTAPSSEPAGSKGSNRNGTSNSASTSTTTTSSSTTTSSNTTSSTGTTTTTASASSTPSTATSSGTSSTASSSALGPRRFRGDVPAFNPSLPLIYTQQMYQNLPQHSRQQQFYPQQPYMYTNQMMGYYPMAVGYDYNPYPQPMYYAPMPNQFHGQAYMNMGLPVYYSSSPNMSSLAPRKKYSKDGYHHNSSGYHSSETLASSDSIPSKEAGILSKEPVSNPSSSSVPGSSSGAASGLSVGTLRPLSEGKSHTSALPKLAPSVVSAPVEPSSSSQPQKDATIETKDSVSEANAQTPAENQTQSSQKSPETVNNGSDVTLPLFFLTSKDEFLADHELAAAFSRKLLKSKTSHFDTFMADNHFAINAKGLEYIVNHDTGSKVYKHIHDAESNDTSKPSSNANDTNDSASTSAASTPKAPLAWSAVLQSADNKTKRREGELASTSNGHASKASLVAKSALKSSIIPEDSDAPQTLGLLMMQYIFDPTFKFDHHDIFSQKPRGLTNSGNICYMNVILQCLIFLEPFASLFHLIESRSIGSMGADSPTPLIDATINFLKDYSTIPPAKKSSGGSFNSDGIVVGKPLSPEPFYQKLIENPKFQHLSWGQQEDAEEFLGYVLDGLHEEFVKAEASIPLDQMEKISEIYATRANLVVAPTLKASILKAARLVRSSGSEHVEESEVLNETDSSNGWSEVGSGRKVCKKRVVEVQPSPITSLFGGRFRSVLTIPKSKEQQLITLDPFRCILLDISLEDVQKVEDALWKFNEIEKIPYKIDADREVVAKKQTFIDELPEVMILHLKRFSYLSDTSSSTQPRGSDNNGLEPELRSYGTIEKVMKNILYGLNLSVPTESLLSSLKRENTNNYSLTAVIYHHGRNAEGGHYTCDVLRPGKRWLRIDDTAVEAIDAEDVLQMTERDKSAYILMYQRKKTN